MRNYICTFFAALIAAQLTPLMGAPPARVLV